MVLNAREKWFKLAFLVYLILAILGSFALSTDKPFYSVDINKDSLGSGSYFPLTAFTVDWVVENSPTISKAHRYSNHPLRNGFLRVFTSLGVIGIAIFSVKSNCKINKNKNYPLMKNPILLKLRI